MATAKSPRATNYLFTWKRWDYDKLREFVSKFKRDGIAEEGWTCKAHKQVQPDDRAYLLRQGNPPKGIFGRGRISGKPYLDEGRWMVNLRFERDPNAATCCSIRRRTGS